MRATESDPTDTLVCHDCGLVQRASLSQATPRAQCVRCDAELAARSNLGFAPALAVVLALLILYIVIVSTPVLTLSFQGDQRLDLLVTGPEALGAIDYPTVALLVAMLTLVMPALRLGGLAIVLATLALHRRAWWVGILFKWTERFRPWAMLDVFLLGGFVAYTRIRDLAFAEVGPAGWALLAYVFFNAALDSALDSHAVWRALSPDAEPDVDPAKTLVSCPGCDLVAPYDPAEPPCPRCDSRLKLRRSFPLQRCAALGVAAIVFYIPANLLPVMTVDRFGDGQPNTILTGVEELARVHMWPLAILVFLASIFVPMMKLLVLGWCLVATWRRSPHRLKTRTHLYRFVDGIGRWSNIDVFMISILVAIVQYGRLTSVVPGHGIAFFAAVVIVTMVAARSFDSRVMWDAAGLNGPRQAARTLR